MSDPHIDDELLQRYADGDLSAPEATTVEATLRSDADAQAQYAAILQLRTLIDASGQQMAQGADSERMFAAIEAGIAAHADEAASARVPDVEPQARGLWARLMRGGGWMPAAIAALAAVLLTIYSPVTPEDLVPPEPKIVPGDAPPDELDPVAADQGTGAAAANTTTPPARSEIIEVDFGQNAGTVFEIALENGSSTPVVWINDNE